MSELNDEPTRPAPDVSPETAAFWKAAADGELLLGRCNSCERLHCPPQNGCPFCWSPAARVAATGTGRLSAVSVVHRHGDAFFSRHLPVVVAWVTLDEGLSFVSSIVDCPVEDLRIDMPLRVVFERLAADVGVPLFAPAEPAGAK